VTSPDSCATTFSMPSHREIVMTRVFQAPRALAFQALTEPRHLVRWWGPRGYTLPVCEVDLRPGGAWRFVHRAPDGSEYPFKGVYLEVVPPERLVYSQIYDVEPYSSHGLIVTCTLAELDRARTELSMTSVFDSDEQGQAMLATGMKAGALESVERLAELLQTLTR
jgi:uncharacterized protein YndB with AHSA1/START domain